MNLATVFINIIMGGNGAKVGIIIIREGYH